MSEKPPSAMSPGAPNQEPGPLLSGTEFTCSAGVPQAAGAPLGVRGMKKKAGVAQATSTIAWMHWTTPDSYLDVVRKLGPIVLDPYGNPESRVNAKYEIFSLGAWTHDGEDLPVPMHMHQQNVIFANALNVNWCSALRLRDVRRGTIFGNPPYGKFLNGGPDGIGDGLHQIIEQGHRAISYGYDMVQLLPAKIDVRWWHEIAGKNTVGHFWRGRLAFGNPSPKHKSQDQPGGGNYTAYFGPNPGKFIEVFEPYGTILSPTRRL